MSLISSQVWLAINKLRQATKVKAVLFFVLVCSVKFHLIAVKVLVVVTPPAETWSVCNDSNFTIVSVSIDICERIKIILQPCSVSPSGISLHPVGRWVKEPFGLLRYVALNSGKNQLRIHNGV